MTKEEAEKIIRDFFYEAAGTKLEDEGDGWLSDNDSNWGFQPGELALLLCIAMAKRVEAAPLEKRPAAFEILDTEEGVYLTRSEIAAQRTGFEYNGLYRRQR